MPIPGAGWDIIWSPDNTWANLIDPDGNVVAQWFQGIPDASTFDPWMTQDIIDKATGPTEPLRALEKTGGGGTGGGVTGYEATGDEFWPGAADFFTDAWEAKEAYSRWLQDMKEQDDAEAQRLYEERRDEQRAYNEQQLAESLARQLTSQHGRQEESWAAAAGAAPGRGAYLLETMLPGYLPRTVGRALTGWGQEMGADYDPAWPGGTSLGEAQITPGGQDWIDYLIQQGYPSYLWER